MPLLILCSMNINSLNPQNNPARHKDRLIHVPKLLPLARSRGELPPDLFSTPGQKELEGLPCTLCQKWENTVLCHLPIIKRKRKKKSGAQKKKKDKIISAQCSTQVETQCILLVLKLGRGKGGGGEVTISRQLNCSKGPSRA